VESREVPTQKSEEREGKTFFELPKNRPAIKIKKVGGQKKKRVLTVRRRTQPNNLCEKKKKECDSLKLGDKLGK